VDGNNRSLIESLLSLRVNALQISPELRKNLVYELIRNDIFLLTTNIKDQFLLEILEIQSIEVQHAILSLVSVLVSTLKGVDYIMTNSKDILLKLIQILKQKIAAELKSPNTS